MENGRVKTKEHATRASVVPINAVSANTASTQQQTTRLSTTASAHQQTSRQSSTPLALQQTPSSSVGFVFFIFNCRALDISTGLVEGQLPVISLIQVCLII